MNNSSTVFQVWVKALWVNHKSTQRKTNKLLREQQRKEWRAHCARDRHFPCSLPLYAAWWRLRFNNVLLAKVSMFPAVVKEMSWQRPPGRCWERPGERQHSLFKVCLKELQFETTVWPSFCFGSCFVEENVTVGVLVNEVVLVNNDSLVFLNHHHGNLHWFSFTFYILVVFAITLSAGALTLPTTE